MIVLVAGGRDFSNATQLYSALDIVLGWGKSEAFFLVNGGARGADKLSSQWAVDRSVRFVEVPVAQTAAEATALGVPYDWTTHGKAAGPLRNAYMLDRFKPTQGVVFSGGNGTADMLERLFRAQVNTWVVGR